MVEIPVHRVSVNEQALLPAFYRRAYGERAHFKYPERWQWAFVDNPFKDEGSPSVYVAVDGRRVVGHVAAIEVPLWINGRHSSLGWSVDSYVLPEYRGCGLGSRLQVINRADHPFFASLAMTSTNKHIKIKKLGAKEGPAATLCIRSLSLSAQIRALQHRLRSRFLVCTVLAMGGLMERVGRAYGWLKGPRFYSATVRVKGPSPAEFEGEEDALWDRTASRYGFAVERHSRYLNWRYRDQPWAQHKCIRAYKGNNELVGLAVFRHAVECSPSVGVVTELFDEHGDAGVLAALLKKAEESLEKMGAAQVQVAVSEPVAYALIRARGYWSVETRPLVLNVPDNWVNSIDTETTALLGKGDQDWDQYSRARFYDYGVLLYRLARRVMVSLKRRVGAGS